MYARGKSEAGIDALERGLRQAWTGEMFARQKSLSGKTLQEFMPRRVPLDPQESAELKVAQMDAWAQGINAQVAAATQVGLEPEMKPSC